MKRRRLSPGAKEALQTLRPVLLSVENGLSHDQAHQILRNEGFDDEGIIYYLDLLRERGYLYEVDGYLFLTDP